MARCDLLAAPFVDDCDSVRLRLIPKLQVTVAVNDAYVEGVVEAIIRGARTGEVGDGKIFVTPLEQCIRIRTGQRGGEAV